MYIVRRYILCSQLSEVNLEHLKALWKTYGLQCVRTTLFAAVRDETKEQDSSNYLQLVMKHFKF
ncbi:hypothetical protein Mapa_011282 [Marchantia paleacea]|nr:hypothetical protein Mapa_011282 [Marchantia paleacea]